MAGVPVRLRQQLDAFKAAEKSDSGGLVVTPPVEGQVTNSLGQPSANPLSVVEKVVEPSRSDPAPSAKDIVPPANATPNGDKPSDATDLTRSREVEPQIVTKEKGDEEDTWKSRYQALKGKYDAEISAVNARLEAIEKNKGFVDGKLDTQLKRIADLERENAELRGAIESGKPDVDLSDFTDEEREAYSESLPVMAKLAQKIADKRMSKVDATVQEIRKAEADRLVREAAEKETHQKRLEDSFVNRVAKDVVGDAGDYQDKFQSLVGSLEWQSFLSNPVRGTGMSVGEHLKAAHDRAIKSGATDEGKEAVVHWFKEFKRLQEKPAQPKSDLPVVPNKTTGGSDIPGDKPILKMSDRLKLGLDFRKKLISKEEFDAALKIYDLAEAEGRLK